jgi:uncharacterized protein (DUF169 family)
LSNKSIADRITAALMLDMVPVALTFTDTPPAGAAAPAQVVPSACSFWRLAEQGVFYAPADAHYNCPVGTMVMGLPMPEAVMGQLGEAVTTMGGCGYLDPAEAAKIPTVQPSAAGILYGPLADIPADPGLVLLWLTPRQAMLYNEAAGTAAWTSDGPLVNGRPACAALPAALSSGSPVMSWGCMGMRTFTGIPDDRLLATIPGTILSEFADNLDRIATANQAMRGYYMNKKEEVATL